MVCIHVYIGCALSVPFQIYAYYYCKQLLMTYNYRLFCQSRFPLISTLQQVQFLYHKCKKVVCVVIAVYEGLLTFHISSISYSYSVSLCISLC